MNDVLPFLRPLAVQRKPGIEAFHFHRQQMIKAYRAWLDEKPSASDVSEELTGTVSALHGLTILADLSK